MKLTENFHLEEFKGLASEPHHIQNFLTLSLWVLEPVREKFGGPIVITSGYRSKEYNEAVGGAPTSQHVLAEACDFLVPNADKMKVYNFVCNDIDFKGQIFVYAKKGHLHIALPRLGILPTRKIMEVKA